MNSFKYYLTCRVTNVSNRATVVRLWYDCSMTVSFASCMVFDCSMAVSFFAFICIMPAPARSAASGRSHRRGAGGWPPVSAPPAPSYGTTPLPCHAPAHPEAWAMPGPLTIFHGDAFSGRSSHTDRHREAGCPSSEPKFMLDLY